MQKFAVFDLDGTLIRWQLYHAAVDRLAKEGLLGPDARDTLREARMRWKRRESGYSFRDYEISLIQTYEQSVTDLSVAEVEAAMKHVIDEYQDQVYTYTRDLIAALKNEGYTMLAISGSHEELVQAIAQHYGFDDWIGTRYKRAGASFTGEKYVASHDKEAALNSLITKHKLTTEGSYAVGDSASDAAMLRMVEHPIAFNPDRALYDIATNAGWDIVIERKNVTYTLRKSQDGYSLLDDTSSDRV
ncbi:HAD-IB family hydrolase [Patescibacteria group bacterium]|nr:MAG: HAD-IB family hydrolase [Patescibacteria group bacterium]